MPISVWLLLALISISIIGAAVLFWICCAPSMSAKHLKRDSRGRRSSD